jgi:hypothetical protein
MNIGTMARAHFSAAVDASREDWDIIDDAERRWRGAAGVGDGLLRLLSSLQHDDPLGAPVNLYTHCLQTATRGRCYDQNSFDPDFAVLPLESFRPLVRRFFGAAAA